MIIINRMIIIFYICLIEYVSKRDIYIFIREVNNRINIVNFIFNSKMLWMKIIIILFFVNFDRNIHRFIFHNIITDIFFYHCTGWIFSIIIAHNILIGKRSTLCLYGSHLYRFTSELKPVFVLAGHIAFIQMAFIRARVLQTFPVNLVCTSITLIFLILAGLYANRSTFLFTETNNICYFKFMLGTNISIFSFDVVYAFPKNIFLLSITM